ncbi:BTB/POZ domain-containing protein At2g30600-like isoform X2 [Panicum virgatum]|uniref:BTB/POZ domain-containing protein At2g30600-like isoform X2 n=1 Tax=Panicum virgatum TaxID=38727 RepID=UPI0019D64C55|nr:BTB/POZ domain-containing protein At2g30600-like isoform X2 [Panicum virgatum]
MGFVEESKRPLTVAPFECAWGEELRFGEPGRGCVAFEASAQNDVTLVFRQQPGSQHYHYKMDSSRHYTVILGSHRNKRLRIEVDGSTVVDVAALGLCCSFSFQAYWISIYDGLISIGRGRHPNSYLLFQWLDPDPNPNVQYVGLSSWDKHVGYRNISILPSAPQNSILWSQMEHAYVHSEQRLCSGKRGTRDDSDSDQRLLADFLESWDFSDAIFVVGTERKVVPAHRVVLCASGDFPFEVVDGATIELPSVPYPVLHSLLEYIYTGSTQIAEWLLSSLLELSSHFKVEPLVKCCKEVIVSLEADKKFSASGKLLTLSSSGFQDRKIGSSPFKSPVNSQKIGQFLANGKYSDINIYVNGHGLVTKGHKLILSLWSMPLAKMFTNGMKESSASDVFFEDVPPEAFFLLLQFMYHGELKVDTQDITSVLVQLLLLSDQFAITVLQFECCKQIMECLSEHRDMTVTSEERVLDAILTWCMGTCETFYWTSVDKLLRTSTPEQLFGKRLSAVGTLLPFVRFPLMQLPMLKRMERSNLANRIQAFRQLVAEAIEFSHAGQWTSTSYECERFQHRRSSYKELQYISDGDSNGVIYYAGTSFGKHQWMNPVLAKNITVVASSPNSRHTDPKALVSKTYQGTCVAGPCIEDGKKLSWWMVDIGQDHQLMCNWYTVRQDGSTTFMRSWVLQGSMDGRNWTSLRVHDGDATICHPGQFASWPIVGPPALLPFRFFRVALTGPAAGSVSNAWNLCICFLELYGYFR